MPTVRALNVLLPFAILLTVACNEAPAVTAETHGEGVVPGVRR